MEIEYVRLSSTNEIVLLPMISPELYLQCSPCYCRPSDKWAASNSPFVLFVYEVGLTIPDFLDSTLR